jgi:2-hydroxychromene-2-carboxylate isomerase
VRTLSAATGPVEYDLHFYFDPVCPFAWLTSKWVREVATQRDYRVDWRFISLRILNSHIDYAAHFPPNYEEGHTAGLRLLRVAARTRSRYGRDAVGRLYQAIGTRIFDTSREVDPLSPSDQGARHVLEPLLQNAGLPLDLADALDDRSLDDEIHAETEQALGLTGRDVGTPILHFRPPDGTAFFGPVISRLPSPDDAVALWDHVVALAGFPGFAEIKRSLRERPQLASFGVDPESAGVEEDWHGGSRRTKR